LAEGLDTGEFQSIVVDLTTIALFSSHFEFLRGFCLLLFFSSSFTNDTISTTLEIYSLLNYTRV
jgi:hypothetical protein